ncbi:MAG TPA: sigma-E factor negative regulatory protein [Luteimonas sp.]|nr:sigma-E factor negative regulatory protein [Luteimonas sp.]
MTPSNDRMDGDRGAEPGVDRILDHQRQQLSALMDGELAPDEARFLLRRLQHDPELLGCWTRWQHSGDCLRKRVELPLPDSFAMAVAQAVARESKPAVVGNAGHRLRWAGGAAIAASAAVLALMLARQSPQASPDAAPVQPRIATAPTPPPAPTPTPTPVAPTPERAPIAAGELATALAVADVPRRIGAARRSRAQSQRAALRTPVQSQQVAQADTAVAVRTAVDPFSGQHISLTERPWPRALLPAAPASGSFNVDYGTRRVETPALYPFAPRNAGELPPSDVRP